MPKIDIEKILCPEVGILKIEDECASAKILDEELDVLECDFNNDMCVEINVKDYSYIVLSLENLQTLKRLIHKAEAYYRINES